MSDHELFYEVGKLTAGEFCEEIWWWIDSEQKTLRVMVRCGERVFARGGSDGQEVTEANLPDLKQALADIGMITPDWLYHGFTLFCARARNMRPLPYYYREHLSVEGDEGKTAALRALFDACGPAR